MDEPNISPLARRLAEQNDVDWRKLSGSGPDGRITERDVIEHLARVAEAEEAVGSSFESWPAQPQEDDEDALLITDDEPATRAEVAYDEIALDLEGLQPAQADEDEALLELDDFVAAAGQQLESKQEEDISLFEDEAMLAADDTGAVEEESDDVQVELAAEESLLARGHAETGAEYVESEPEEARPEEATGLGKLPLASFGLLLRSHVKLTPLTEAQSAVGRSLGQDVSPAAFLVRAAAKALYSQPLGQARRIGLAIISERGLGIRAIPEADSVSFVELLETVAELSASSSAERDEVDVVVADMSDYAVDEAVLNVGMPVLTLGRVLVDSSSGHSYSTLSLSGDLPPAMAASLLSRAAELLGSPIELVL